jgi:hypothetical protein
VSARVVQRGAARGAARGEARGAARGAARDAAHPMHASTHVAPGTHGGECSNARSTVCTSSSIRLVENTAAVSR